MKTLSRIFGLLAVAAAMLATPAVAQSERAISLSGDVKVVKSVTDASGQATIEYGDTSVVVPGDRLIFRTNYKNTSAELVENFVVTNPLPSAVVLASDSAADLQVSVDGGETFGLLADLTVAEEDGSTRAANASDATHLRWVLDVIQPGETGQITFYAIVR
ncbi:hypothetical protein HKD42_03445 [Altererythrobacter sp. RZ02]|uniref:DUF11 domain-containing protein n=1 Tax=Pontixanthobacter rizhaonensis TaxID=2730337 RepID=A0A848QJY6_9SPHN|nr:hypothetical protein [Pontixanthobacter rizhaonensis]NMW31109.1 hypothetical protein [Pontixanthobacter rizhaonensis]